MSVTRDVLHNSVTKFEVENLSSTRLQMGRGYKGRIQLNGLLIVGRQVHSVKLALD